MKKVIKDIFLMLMFYLLKNYMNFMIYNLPERMEIEKVKKLVTNLHDKTMLFTQEI